MTSWPVPEGWLRQPDARSCGAASVVAARLLTDPSFAATLRSPEAAGATVLATHQRLTGLRSPTGSAQLPWPRALGTPPWAVAAELATLTGRPYRQRVVRWSGDGGFDDLTGHGPAVLYVGSRLLPRHVVLVVEAVGRDTLRVFDPAAGALRAMSREDFAAHRLPGRWRYRWFALHP